MLQQAPKQAVVWGHCPAAACASVKVQLLGPGAALVAEVAASAGGAPNTWIAKLPPTTGGSTPHTVRASAGGATATLSDVLFGDVWVCSGQSNSA